MPGKKSRTTKAGYRMISEVLSALLLAGLITVSLVSCSENADIEGSSNAEIPGTESVSTETQTNSQYDTPPAWASAIQMNNRQTASAEDVKKEAAAVSTMYADSLEDAFGGVSKITVYAKDNPDLPYDVVSHMERADQTIYLFLPSNLDLDSVRVRALHNDGTETGIYTLDFTKGTDYGVMIKEDIYYKVVPKQSKIPSLMIQIDEEKGKISSMNGDGNHNTYCYGDMTLLVSDELAREKGWDRKVSSFENDHSQAGTMKMRGRGNWTWAQKKKPYQITLEKKTDLLGMGKAKNYLLLANVMDASLLRNQLFYDLGTEMGLAYSPDIEPVDVFMNGKYIGQFSLCEKVEVGESRVDIDEEKDFLLELDHYYYNEVYTFITNNNKTFTLHNQETKDGVSQIKGIMNRIEKKIYKHDDDSYRDVIDVESWVKYWWLQDISRNNDTFIGSNYFYYVYDEEKLYAGPIWDMDNTLGIWGGGENLDPKHWHSDDRGWLKHLYQHDDFYNELMDYYSDTAAELFNDAYSRIDKYAEYIRESAEMNYIVCDRELFVNCGTHSWEEDIEYLKDFLGKRLDWYADNVGW